MKLIKRKRGRPKSRIPSKEYTRKQLISSFQGYYSEKCFAELADKGLIDTENKLIFFARDGRMQYILEGDEVIEPLTKIANPKEMVELIIKFNNKNIKTAFSDGIKYGIEIVSNQAFPEFLDDSIENYGLTINISRIARNHEKQIKKIGQIHNQRIREARMEFVNRMHSHSPLPNDILRKVRKSKIPRIKLLRFIRLIKESEGLAYTEEIIHFMRSRYDEIHTLVAEAKRQKIAISVEKDSFGKEFLMVK
jgi:hypothetical protein